MKPWIILLTAFILWTSPLIASEPAYSTLPIELVRLRDSGQLKVRYMWAWRLVRELTHAMVLEFEALGLDLLDADPIQLEEWRDQADGGQLQLSTEQYQLLVILLDWIESGENYDDEDLYPFTMSRTKTCNQTTEKELPATNATY
jgi:hypothetical protein